MPRSLYIIGIISGKQLCKRSKIAERRVLREHILTRINGNRTTHGRNTEADRGLGGVPVIKDISRNRNVQADLLTHISRVRPFGSLGHDRKAREGHNGHGGIIIEQTGILTAEKKVGIALRHFKKIACAVFYVSLSRRRKQKARRLGSAAVRERDTVSVAIRSISRHRF